MKSGSDDAHKSKQVARLAATYSDLSALQESRQVSQHSDEREVRSTMFAITSQPEFGIAVFSFLLHFVWEYLQAPTYVGMTDLPHWEGVKLCTSATIGDVGIALTAFWIASAVSGSRYWFVVPGLTGVLTYLAVGVALTVGLEYYYTEISIRWTYSDLMPLVPPFGTGLSPLLQWLVIPQLALWFTRRQLPRDRPDQI